MMTAAHKYTVFFSLSLTMLISANTIKKHDLELDINDLSINDKQKVIGEGSAKVLVKDLNSYGIYPVAIEISNKRDQAVQIVPSGFSLKPHTLDFMQKKTPTLKFGEQVAAGIGAPFALLGTLSVAFQIPMGNSRKLLYTISSFALAWAVYQKYTKQKNHNNWFAGHMLPVEGVLINPGEKVKKYVFFSEDIYSGDGLTMNIKSGSAETLNVQIIAKT